MPPSRNIFLSGHLPTIPRTQNEPALTIEPEVPENLSTVLAAAAAGCSLGGQTLFLRLGAEEPAVFKFSQDA